MKKVGDKSVHGLVFSLMSELQQLYTHNVPLDFKFATVTATTLVVGDVSLSADDVRRIDGITPGTAAASKALVLGAAGEIATITTATITSLTTTTLTLGAVVVTATAAELNMLAGVTAGTVTASKALVVDANKDLGMFRDVGMRDLYLGWNGAGGYAGSLTIRDGNSPGVYATLAYADLYKIDGITNGTAAAGKALVLGAAGEIATIVSLTVTKLILGSTEVTSSGAELNLLDGSTAGMAVAGRALVVDANIDLDNLRDVGMRTLYLGLNGVGGYAGTLFMFNGLDPGSYCEISAIEMSVLDGVTPGTAALGKAVVLGAAGEIATITTATITNLTTTNAYINNATFGTDVSSCVLTFKNGSGSSVQFNYTDIARFDDVTPGTAVWGKVLILGATGGITTIASATIQFLTTDSLTIGATAVTSTAAELNILDGVTSTAAELNILDGVTATAAQLNFLSGVTAGTAAASKAMVLNASGDITLVDGGDFVLGTTTGTMIGTGATQKLGFYGATPVVRQRVISYGHTYTFSGSDHVNLANIETWMTETTDIINKLGDALNNLGLAPWVDHASW